MPSKPPERPRRRITAGQHVWHPTNGTHGTVDDVHAPLALGLGGNHHTLYRRADVFTILWRGTSADGNPTVTPERFTLRSLWEQGIIVRRARPNVGG